MSSLGGPVAILGMGRMGEAMAGTINGAGFDVVVYNRTRAKADAIAERLPITVSDSARDAVATSPVVISMLADDDSVVEVLTAAASGLQPGAVVLEMSTIDPATLERVRPAIDAAGATLLDAPVSGSVQLVESGGLTIMVGGDPAALKVARPVLDALATTIFHLGSGGAGATMKLAVNSIIHSLNVAVAEALVLAEKAGVDRADAYEVFANSAVAAPYVHYKRDAFERPEEAAVAFNLELVGKDLDLILNFGHQVGAPLDQGHATRQIIRAAVDAGFADADLSAVASFLRGR